MTDKHVAALIIIGDEVLKGQVQDANTMYLAKSLQTIGIKIRRVVVIPDEVDVIASEVSQASKNYPIVFTSGGVGPTHDDLTYEGVAKGLGLTLKENEELLSKFSRLFPEHPESRRLAIVPSPCEFIDVASRRVDNDTHAIVKARNVYVLPGSPCYFRPAVDSILPSLSAGLPLYEASVDVELDEFELVQLLDEQASSCRGRVAIGSYPQEVENGRRTRITLEGRSRQEVERVKREILAGLPREKLVGMGRFDLEMARRVYESGRELEHVGSAFRILEECYDGYKANEVFLSFNGGKDCTVVLHLAATLAQLRNHEPPLCLYVTGDAFPEVNDFVHEAASYYGLEMIRTDGPIMRALAELLDERPELKACLLGTRKNDPGAHALEPFAPTDAGWPSVMRVSPIIDWSYSQVWQFLLKHKVPYCSLYDEGYTSLGAKDTTTKNPLLRDPQDPSRYLPAHTLADDSTERHGRG